MDPSTHTSVTDGHNLLEGNTTLQELPMLLALLEVWVVFQATHHVHHILVLKEFLHERRVVEKDPALDDCKHLCQALGIVQVLTFLQK